MTNFEELLIENGLCWKREENLDPYDLPDYAVIVADQYGEISEGVMMTDDGDDAIYTENERGVRFWVDMYIEKSVLMKLPTLEI